MKAIVLSGILVTGFLSAETPGEPPDLTSMRIQYNNEIHDAKKPLVDRYVTQLDSLLKTLTKSKDFNGAIAVQKEIDRYRPQTPKSAKAEETFIGHTYKKPGSKPPFGGNEVYTFRKGGGVERADGEKAGWESLDTNKIKVWKGENTKETNPMMWTFDESFETANVYSPFHRTTVKATLAEAPSVQAPPAAPSSRFTGTSWKSTKGTITTFKTGGVLGEVQTNDEGWGGTWKPTGPNTASAKRSDGKNFTYEIGEDGKTLVRSDGKKMSLVKKP